MEWTIAEQACYMQSISILTVYATLGKEGLKYALQEAEITHLFTSGKLIPTVRYLFILFIILFHILLFNFFYFILFVIIFIILI